MLALSIVLRMQPSVCSLMSHHERRVKQNVIHCWIIHPAFHYRFICASEIAMQTSVLHLNTTQENQNSLFRGDMIINYCIF